MSKLVHKISRNTPPDPDFGMTILALFGRPDADGIFIYIPHIDLILFLLFIILLNCLTWIILLTKVLNFISSVGSSLA